MNELSISLPELLSILGLIVTVSIAFGTVLFNLWRKISSNSESVKDTEQRLSEELGAFKLNVAERYVSGKRLADMEQKVLLSEERLISTISNLASRIDRVLERMERK